MTSDEALANNAWRFNLPTFAHTASNGRWLPYLWLRIVAEIIVREVLKGNARIIIEAPPRHGKSETFSKWLPTWFLELFSDKRVFLTSYADRLASKFGRHVRDEFQSNDLLWTKIDPRHARSNDWSTTDGGGMQTAGIAGSTTGFGFDLGIVDDPHKDWAGVQSAHQRQTVVDWFNSVFFTRKEPNASIVLIQTRWNERDLAGYLINEHADNWLRIRLPSLAEEDDMLGREIGEALCPERYPAEVLRGIRVSIGSQMFAGLFQQRPGAAEGNIVKRDWIKYYGGPTGIELPPLENVMQSWDLNFGKIAKSKKASHVAGICGGQNGANIYMLDLRRGKWRHTENKRQVKAFRDDWPDAEASLIEDAASGAALVDDMKDSLDSVIAVPVKGSKEMRFESVSPMWEAGNVWLPHPTIAPWVPNYVEKIVNFPNIDENDEIDATSLCLLLRARSSESPPRSL